MVPMRDMRTKFVTLKKVLPRIMTNKKLLKQNKFKVFDIDSRTPRQQIES